MNEIIIEKAKELARMLAASEEFKTMRAAEDAGARDERMIAAFARYSELQGQIKEASLKESPDFGLIGALSRELEETQNELQNGPAAQAMREARERFSALMNDVNREFSRVLDPNFGKKTSGCTGNCASCGGCGN